MQNILLAILALGTVAHGAVTIEKATPIEHLDAGGQVTAVTMATPLTKYDLVICAGSELTIKDAAGSVYRVTVSATDYTPTTVVPPAPAAIPPPAPKVIEVANTSPAPVASAPAPSAIPDSGASPAEIAAINTAFGARLFSTKNLWDEKDTTVAIRLGWPQDGNSSILASYRHRDQRQAPQLHLVDTTSDGPSFEKSTVADPSVTVDRGGRNLINYFNSHAYSSTLYSRQGHPDFIVMIFANDGDISPANPLNYMDSKDPEQLAFDAIKRDRRFLDHELTVLFGQSETCNFGADGSTEEPAHRWDWNGTAFLLTTGDKYTGIIICPTAFADRNGLRTTDDRIATRDNLTSHVHTSPNGDVLISDIPAVDQGDIGYCAPATCERYCRYLDIPSDMYILASVFDSKLGGGAYTSVLNTKLENYLKPYEATVQSLGDAPSMSAIKASIDKGEPIMWACWFDDPVEKEVIARAQLRQQDWAQYTQLVKTTDARIKSTGTSAVDKLSHIRLVIGYNPTTDELAFSDSYGYSKPFWMTLTEAQYMHYNYFAAIQLK